MFSLVKFMLMICTIGGEQEKEAQTLDVTSSVQIGNSLTNIILSASPVVSKVLPPGTPSWAARINECEVSRYWAPTCSIIVS